MGSLYFGTYSGVDGEKKIKNHSKGGLNHKKLNLSRRNTNITHIEKFMNGKFWSDISLFVCLTVCMLFLTDPV